MDEYLVFVTLIIASFLIGSIPTGYLIARRHGVDIRQHGSGNIGATNVGRVLGKKLAALTFILDVLKGTVATVLGIIPYLLGGGSITGMMSNPIGITVLQETAPVLGVVVILGHCFTPFLLFRGGKGVATGLGVFLVLAPIPTLASLTVFVLGMKLSGTVSIGSICAVLIIVCATIFGVPHPYSALTVLAAILASSLVVLRHLPNIRRLIDGKELSVEKKSAT